MAYQPGVFGTVARRPAVPIAPGSPSEDELRKQQLAAAAQAAGTFAGAGEAGYGNLTNELAADRQYLRDLRDGKNSLAAEQLRQGVQQQQAAQQSMAASATPANAVMAARNAANNMAKAQYGMSGQAAMARLAEQRDAARLLQEANLQQRQQDINVGLGSRENQMTGLGVNRPDKPKEPSFGQRLAAGVGAALPMLFSDERLKEDVKGGDKAARRVLDKLAAKTYKYKDEKHGQGEQLGFIAQDLEKAGAKSAVIDTPVGKAIDTNKLAGVNTALIASVAKRLSRLEKGRK